MTCNDQHGQVRRVGMAATNSKSVLMMKRSAEQNNICSFSKGTGRVSPSRWGLRYLAPALTAMLLAAASVRAIDHHLDRCRGRELGYDHGKLDRGFNDVHR